MVPGGAILARGEDTALVGGERLRLRSRRVGRAAAPGEGEDGEEWRDAHGVKLAFAR